MLSDKKTSLAKVARRRPKDFQKSWGDQQKIEAVETFIMLGGQVMPTAAALQIPRQTLQHWMKTKWWAEIYDEVKQQDNIVLSLRLQKIVARSMDLVEDRLEKGDFFYDQKTGKIARKEVSLKDAHDVMQTSFKMRAAVEKPPEAALEESSVMDKLQNLAKQFEQFAAQQKEKPKVEVTDVVFIEEKEHGMQEEER
jgi:hypothetical protein